MKRTNFQAFISVWVRISLFEEKKKGEFGMPNKTNNK